MKERGYTLWEFPLEKPELTGYEILQMDEKILHPWFLKRRKIIFSHQPLAVAMELSNYNVDVSINLVYS